MLYQRYASPKELIQMHIDQGQFGEFVQEFLSAEAKRKQEAAEKENDQKLWELYLRVMPEKSFNDWKAEVTEETASKSTAQFGKRDDDMTNEDVNAIIKHLFRNA